MSVDLPTRPARAPGAPRRRDVGLTAVLLVAALVGVVVTLGTGPLAVAAADLVPTLLGDRPTYEYAVLDTGLPRALLALLVGACLGAAGALTQALTRNPLGSPDLIGFDAGAATGALVAILLLGLAGGPVSLAAMTAGLLTALTVFGLARGASGAGYRLIVVGIAIAALLQGVNSFLLTRSDPREALEGARWLVGSLNLVGEVDSLWSSVTLAGVALVVLVPPALALVPSLRLLALGDELAVAAGVRVPLVQTATIVVAVLLAAAAVSLTGPITFVALVAPQLLAGLRRRPGPAVVGSALVGASLLLYSDLLGQRLLPGTPLPVCVVTGVLGGGYLAWLLARGRTRT